MNELEKEDLVFRPFTDKDRPFIENSWADSYYGACRLKDSLSPDDFHAFHRPLRERFFNRPTATVIVVSPAEDPEHILGWIAVEVLPNCTLVHYVYVKAAYRRDYHLSFQLLERAVPSHQVLFTHCTPKASKIMAAHPERFRQFRFAPHLV